MTPCRRRQTRSARSASSKHHSCSRPDPRNGGAGRLSCLRGLDAGAWAVAAFDAADKTYGEDYIAFPVPGTDGLFDFLADSFTLPVGAENVEGAKAWLETISSKEGQIAFNKVKGSIPARSDLTDDEISEFGEYQQDAMKAFASDTIVSSIAHGAAAPVAVSNEMNDAVAKFAQGASDVAGLQDELTRAAEPMSK